MPSLFSRLWGAVARSHPPIEAKDSRAAALLALHSIGQARWTARDTISLVRQGFERNAVVYRAVRIVAESAASVPWLVFDNGKEVTSHPLADLFMRPNPGEVGPVFLEAVFTNLLLFGNAYIETSLIDGVPRELYALRPDRVSIVPGPRGWPMAYDYMIGADRVRYPISAEGVPQILQLKLFHPLNDHYGFAPIAAAQVAIDIHNAACGWNKALLDNSARPSGALVYAGPDGAKLSQEQFERLKGELDESFQGPRNAGRPLLLEGGLDWKALSLSPKDMDFVEAKAAAAREIALVFGVPPMMLGIPGDNTYSNYQEANRALWRQTVIPLINRTQKAFAAWLTPAFGSGLAIDYNLDRVEALSVERESEWRRVNSVGFLTQDEKRQAVGYGALKTGERTAADVSAALSAAPIATKPAPGPAL